MNILILIRCFVVSLIIGLSTPMFTIEVIAPIGPDGAPMLNIGVDPSSNTPLPEMRRLVGLEKYRYMLAAGWLWQAYLRASVMYFIIAFVASFGVSVWNVLQGRSV